MQQLDQPRTILIVGHGSRQPSANASFEALVAAYRRRHSQWNVVYGYIELAEPTLGDALARACAAAAGGVVLLPLFLFRAGHVKNDVAEAVIHARQQFPGVSIQAADALGVHPFMQNIMLDRARACGLPAAAPDASCQNPLAEASKNTAVIVVGRGSSDPDANSDFCKLVRLFAEQTGLSWVIPCFTAVTGPSVEEALEFVSLSKPDRLIVLPHYLFNGVLVARIEDKVRQFAATRPWLDVKVAGVIECDDRLLALMDERLEDVLGGRGPLPCTNCRYRNT